ncbi:MAG: hypothetical protein HC913_17000 [Microscillaceae bacterium]|nr:hypothetical protein [Microscillaceae bacterium]
MKKISCTILFLGLALFTLQAQKAEEGVKITEGELPIAVKQISDDESWGWYKSTDEDGWYKISLSNAQTRYVCAQHRLSLTTGRMLSERYRFNSNGRLTSWSQYLGSEENEEDILNEFLPTGGGDEKSEAFAKKLDQILKKNTVLSCAKIKFAPGRETDSEKEISAIRLVPAKNTVKLR